MAYAKTACITHVSPYDSSEAISAERRCKNVLKILQSDIVTYDTRRAAASINFYNMNYGEVIDIFENLEFKTLSDYERLAESYMFFCQLEKFQNTVRLIISHLEILVCVHKDIRFEEAF